MGECAHKSSHWDEKLRQAAKDVSNMEREFRNKIRKEKQEKGEEISEEELGKIPMEIKIPESEYSLLTDVQLMAYKDAELRRKIAVEGLEEVAHGVFKEKFDAIKKEREER